MKVLLVGDVHIMGRSPKARRDNLAETVFRKLSEVAEIAIEQDVDLVLFSGDIFDYPFQSYKILVMAWTFFSRLLFGRRGCAVYGQHDLFFQRLEEADEKTALGAVSKMTDLEILGARPVEVTLFEDPPQVFHIYGASFGEPIPEIQSTEVEVINILVIHRMISPKAPWKTAKLGEDYDSPSILHESDWFDLVLCGDWHGSFYWQSKAGTHIINPGALVRKTGGEIDYNRIPSVAIWDVDTNEIDEYPLTSAKPSEEVLTREHIEAELKQTRWLDDFVHRIKAGGSSVGPMYMVVLLETIERLKSEKKISTRVLKKIYKAIEYSAYKDLLNQELLNGGFRKSKEDSEKSRVHRIKVKKPDSRS